MAELNTNRIVNRYNKMVETLGFDASMIQPLTSSAHWNLRDLVAEADYILSTYYDGETANGAQRHSENPEKRKLWSRETSRLKRFINQYESNIAGLVCYANHCSRFDNK